MEAITNEKLQALAAWFEERGPIAVAFSGGTDSTLLLAAAQRYSPYPVLACTALLQSQLTEDRLFVQQFCQERDIAHVVFALDEDGIEGFSDNPPNRCYLCKSKMYEQIIMRAADKHIETVVDGTNTDDLLAERPGRRALQEHGIALPFVDCQLSKCDVREISREWSLPTWDKPSNSCLYTRIAFNEPITPEKIECIRKTEAHLCALGIRRTRARLAQGIMKIELEV